MYDTFRGFSWWLNIAASSVRQGLVNAQQCCIRFLQVLFTRPQYDDNAAGIRILPGSTICPPDSQVWIQSILLRRIDAEMQCGVQQEHFPSKCISERNYLGDFPGRTHGDWTLRGLHDPDRIPGAEPQSSTDAASLAPLAMIGQVGCGPESFRTPLIMIDNRMWMAAVVYLAFMCILARNWTLGWRTLVERTRTALSLRSEFPGICGNMTPSCVLTFPLAYQLAVPPTRSRSSDSMATGSFTSGGMLPLAAGTSGSPIRGGGRTNRGDGRARTRPMDL
ncbi:hypothetical protein B0H14DRAFT_2572597 [Mycena olivaceomarginata]|nr:hypothetical protein B0H14DRAFT_2572597 [Mycena olivaceomarginata]